MNNTILQRNLLINLAFGFDSTADNIFPVNGAHYRKVKKPRNIFDIK